MEEERNRGSDLSQRTVKHDACQKMTLGPIGYKNPCEWNVSIVLNFDDNVSKQMILYWKWLKIKVFFQTGYMLDTLLVIPTYHSLFHFLSKQTSKFLAGCMPTNNKSHIIQLPMQQGVTLWLNSGPRHKSRREVCNFRVVSLRARGKPLFFPCPFPFVWMQISEWAILEQRLLEWYSVTSREASWNKRWTPKSLIMESYCSTLDFCPSWIISLVIFYLMMIWRHYLNLALEHHNHRVDKFSQAFISIYNLFW